MYTQLIIQRKSTGTKWCDVATVRASYENSYDPFNKWLSENREPEQVYRLIEVLDVDWVEEG